MSSATRPVRRSLFVSGILAAIAVLAGCGRGSGAASSADALPLSMVSANRTVIDSATVASAAASVPLANAPFESEPEKFSILRQFRGKLKGFIPVGLIDVGGTLYGVTENGGANASRQMVAGTLYSLSPGGEENVIYNFGSSPEDGVLPKAALTYLDGVLYGTTSSGGSFGYGTIFSVTLSGTETILHSFTGAAGDGAYPERRMIAVNGTLYGTTPSRELAPDEAGTVFSITPGGAYTVLHVFPTGYGDGFGPRSELIDVNGTLYGTTEAGGSNSNGGTVFSIDPMTGTESIVYRFQGGSDGAQPIGALVDVGGTLYGTTNQGGPTNRGTVFGVSTTGAEHVVYYFAGGSDGATPLGDLTVGPGGILLGTTFFGGSADRGTIYAVTTGGSEKIVHSFKGTPGGSGLPTSGLLDVGGVFYGTAQEGTFSDREGGAVYTLRL